MPVDPVLWLLSWVDPFLIAPYRLPGHPVAGWWLGTVLLALWSTIIGELTLAALYRLNHRHIRKVAAQMNQGHHKSWEALKYGDKLAFKGFNDMANEAFGKAFFLQIAMGSSALWPAFFALAWLKKRFYEVPIPLPWVEWPVTYAAAFIVLYILVRIAFSKVKKHLPFFKGSLALARSLSPDERQEVLGEDSS